MKVTTQKLESPLTRARDVELGGLFMFVDKAQVPRWANNALWLKTDYDHAEALGMSASMKMDEEELNRSVHIVQEVVVRF